MKTDKLQESLMQHLSERKLVEQEADLPDLTWILDEYDTEIATKEEIGRDYSYRKLVTNTDEAERFNYHSDYWGDADTYQEEMVDFVGIVEPYVGKNVIIDIDNESYTYKVLGVLIDTQYNSLGHACILVEEPEREIQGDKVEEAKKTLDDLYSNEELENIWNEKFDELVPKEGKASTALGEIMRNFSSLSYALFQNGDIISKLNYQPGYYKNAEDLDDAVNKLGDNQLKQLINKMWNTRSESAYDHYMAEFYEYFINNYLKDKVEESKEETYYYEIHFDYTKESGKDSDGYSKFFKSKKAVPNETTYVIDLALDENVLDDDDKADIEYIDYAQQIDEIDYRDATGDRIDEAKPIIKRKSNGETLTKSQIRDKYKQWCEENGWTKDEYSYNDYLRDIDESGEWELIKEATNLQDMRNSNLDWFKNMGYEEYKTGDNFICLANTKGEIPVAVMFYGKAAKPRWHYKFRSIDELEQYVNNYLGQKDVQEKIKANRRAERKLTKDHDVKVGDIFYTYWGYDQTNSEFYEVVDVKGSRLYLKEVGYETDDSDSSWGQDKIKPIPGDFVDEEIHKASVRADGTVTNLDGESFLSLSKYEGGWIKVTASGWGH